MNPKRRSLRIKAKTDAIPDPIMMKNNNLYLPEELIVEHILSRLPVKSLLRFCCVSKRWRSIISDPVFAKTHFKMASQHQTLSQKLLRTNLVKLRSLDLEATTSFGKKSCVRELKNPFEYPMQIRYVVGSVNGLLCLEVIDVEEKCYAHYIWNPSNGFIIKLPDYLSVLPDVDTNYLMYCGFGYASATDDYKLLINLRLGKGEQYCLMFSSRYKCWKKVGDPRLSIWNNNSLFKGSVWKGCYSNEALHWVQRKSGSESEAVKYAILAFDLATEEFREVPLPMNNNDNGVQQRVWAEVLSVVLRGCLSITSREELTGFHWVVTVWVMREYGFQHSWSKLFKIGCRDRSWIFSLYQTILIIYEENGTIVLKGRTWNCYEYVRFDCKENMCDEVVVSSRWRDMVLVPQEEWNFDNLLVRTGRRYKSRFHDVFRYDESLLKIQL